MLDRVLRGGDWELVKQRNKLKNCQTDYRSKLPDKSSSPEAIKTTVQFSIVHARNSSRYSQAKLIVRFVVKWREFRGNKKNCDNFDLLRKTHANALNQSRTGKTRFLIYSSRFLDGFERLSAEATFRTPCRSHSENVASARRVRQK